MYHKPEYALCRLCLCRGDCMTDIFDENNKMEFVVERAIEDLLQLKVAKETAFPWLVCSTCLDKVSEFRLFKLRCVESLVVFYNRVKRGRVEDKDCETGPEKKRRKGHSDDEMAAQAQVETGVDDGVLMREVGDKWQGGRGILEAIVPSCLKEETESMTSEGDLGAEPIITCDFEGQEFRVDIKQEESVDFSDGVIEGEVGGGRGTARDNEKVLIEPSEVSVKVEDMSDPLGDRTGGVEVDEDKGFQPNDFLEIRMEDEAVANAKHLGDNAIRSLTCRAVKILQCPSTIKMMIDNEAKIQTSGTENNGVVGNSGRKTSDDRGAKKQATDGSRNSKVRKSQGGKPKEYSSSVDALPDKGLGITSGTVREESGVDGNGVSEVRKHVTSPDPAVHDDKQHECTTCGRRFKMKGHMTEHQRTHGGDKPHQCTICGKRFLKKGSHSVHLRTHEGLKPHRCELCGKSFSRKSHVTEHQRIHGGEKPYECTTCGKSFSQKGSLSMHEKTHTGLKSYRCEVCGKGFIYKGHMVEHLRVHTGEKPYECPHCDKCFSQRVGLSKHLLNHSGERPYRCTVCGKRFNQRGYLGEHMRIHTGEKPFMCELCGKRFSHKGSMTKHIQTHSSKIIPV